MTNMINALATPNYWLFKSEPDCWSWAQQKSKGLSGEEWSGVRNFEARNNMQKMQLGERGFFYHSGKERQIMGIIEICKIARPDSTAEDDRWHCVDIRAIGDLMRPISLAEVKEHPQLIDMALVKRSRLSVAPVTAHEWQTICNLAMGL